jgi:hypothetical protein
MQRLLFLSPVQMSDTKGTPALLDALPPAEIVLADKDYDADWFREALEDKGIAACIPVWRGRRIATHHDRCGEQFLSAIGIPVTIMFWLCVLPLNIEQGLKGAPGCRYISKRIAIQRREEGFLCLGQRITQAARWQDATRSVGSETLRHSVMAPHRSNDRPDQDLFRGAGKDQAAVAPSLRYDETFSGQLARDLRQVVFGYPEQGCDLRGRQAGWRADRKGHEDAEGVIGELVEFHRHYLAFAIPIKKP